MESIPHRWIDRNDPDQLNWIIAYLSQYDANFALVYAFGSLDQPEARTSVIEAIDKHIDDPAFYVRYRKMQDAWRQRKSRRHPQRRTVTFQLHHDTLTLLDQLAVKRDDTKVNVLATSIKDAWHKHERAAKEMKKASDIYKARLKDQREKYQQKDHAYWHATEGLLDALAESLNQRCRLEAVFGEYDNKPLEEADKAAYQALMDKRLSALERPLRDLKLLRLKHQSLRQRLVALAPEQEASPSEGSA